LVGAVAREAIEAYGEETPSHPSGTGAFRLKRYVRSSKIVLERNPDYRSRGGGTSTRATNSLRAFAERMRGKRLP
jgi:ABC-type transport system substrate-binding protein